MLALKNNIPPLVLSGLLDRHFRQHSANHSPYVFPRQLSSGGRTSNSIFLPLALICLLIIVTDHIDCITRLFIGTTINRVSV